MTLPRLQKELNQCEHEKHAYNFVCKSEDLKTCYIRFYDHQFEDKECILVKSMKDKNVEYIEISIQFNKYYPMRGPKITFMNVYFKANDLVILPDNTLNMHWTPAFCLHTLLLSLKVDMQDLYIE